MASVADLSLSQARFAANTPGHSYVPEAVGTVVSSGAAVDNFHRAFGAVRLRYFGPRALGEDNSVRSKATTLINLEGGFQAGKNLRVNVDVFNVFDPKVSDIDYYFTSRLPGEPLSGVDDLHLDPAVPRTVRLSMAVGF